MGRKEEKKESTEMEGREEKVGKKKDLTMKQVRLSVALILAIFFKEKKTKED